MINIERLPWESMISHATNTYPYECAGAMLGTINGDDKTVVLVVPLANCANEDQSSRYDLRPEDLLAADIEARRRGIELIGIYHSRPDCDAYFSETDLKNSCPWYSFVVIAVFNGKFDHANSWIPDAFQTAAEKEQLNY